jgi:hypothetical protein
MVERSRPDLASAMYPALSREAKEREAIAQRQAAEQNRRKQKLAADLRELNARLQREGRR